jgi:hypothetical protein
MRPSQKGRGSRNKGGRNKPVGNVINRVFESAGPEGKVRGTPQQIIEKYQLLARDAQTAGERVLSENFLQHAEHYTRLLNAAYEQAEERRQQQAHAQPDGGGGGEDRRQPRADVDPRGDGGGSAESLETIDASTDDGPVETPESASAAPERAAAPESAPSSESAAAPEGETATAVEAPEKPAPRRSPRKSSANGASGTDGDEAAEPRKAEPRRRRRKAPAAESEPADAHVAEAPDAGGA